MFKNVLVPEREEFKNVLETEKREKSKGFLVADAPLVWEGGHGRGGQGDGGGDKNQVLLEFVDLADAAGKHFRAHLAGGVAGPLQADPQDILPEVPQGPLPQSG